MLVCISVPIKGGGRYSPGPRSPERHSVPAEIHPGSKSNTPFVSWDHLCSLSESRRSPVPVQCFKGRGASFSPFCYTF